MKRRCCALLTACALLCLSMLSCARDVASETTAATTIAATAFTIDTESDIVPTVHIAPEDMVLITSIPLWPTCYGSFRTEFDRIIEEINERDLSKSANPRMTDYQSASTVSFSIENKTTATVQMITFGITETTCLFSWEYTLDFKDIPTVCYLEFEDPELYSLIQTYIESATADAVWEVFEASWAEHTAASQPQ
ncbi:MAG: hypothetical protein IJW99_11385 [Clostridia bacterium]|nr:hypothetical protein [Clostridia bacterium]